MTLLYLKEFKSKTKRDYQIASLVDDYQRVCIIVHNNSNSSF